MNDADSIEFPARKVPLYAEPISHADLIVGTVYFTVQFIDNQLMVPILQPVVFLGENLVGTTRGELYFQDAETYVHGLRIDQATSDELQRYFYAQPRDQTNHIFTFDHAVDAILRCAWQRMKRRA